MDIKKKLLPVYQINQLEDKALWNALTWLNENPLEYENEHGEMVPEPWDDIWYCDGVDFVTEHCEVNGYLFDINGNPVHHLVVEH